MTSCTSGNRRCRAGSIVIAVGLFSAFLATSAWIQSAATEAPASRPAPSTENEGAARMTVDRAVEAHGGEAAWRRLGQATFEVEMQRFDTAGAPAGPPSTVVISFPTSGEAVVDGSMGEVKMRYADGVTSVWNSLGEVADPALHARAKFMLPTFHYIFSLPWKLRDDGTILESIAGRTDEGRDLRGVRVTYRPGVGDTPDDWYKFYFDSESGRLHDVLWIITAPGHDDTIEWCRFEDQRLVDGIWIPHQWTFVHAREDGEPLGPPAMRARLVRVSFSAGRAEAASPASQPATQPAMPAASQPASQPATRPAVTSASSQASPILEINKERPGEPLEIAGYLVPGKITIFDFYSVYCGPCMVMAPYLERLALKRPDIVLRKVDINRPRIRGIDWSSPLARQYRLESIPHLKIFGPDGKLMSEGDAAYRTFLEWLRNEGPDS